jgi:hypothetical protein
VEKRNILDWQGRVIGEMELADGTPEEVWEKKLAVYAAPPVTPTAERITMQKVAEYQSKAEDLLKEVMSEIILGGFTTSQLDAIFDQLTPVIVRMRMGGFQTAMYRLQNLSPEAPLTQAMVNSFISKLGAHI